MPGDFLGHGADGCDAGGKHARQACSSSEEEALHVSFLCGNCALLSQSQRREHPPGQFSQLWLQPDSHHAPATKQNQLSNLSRLSSAEPRPGSYQTRIWSRSHPRLFPSECPARTLSENQPLHGLTVSGLSHRLGVSFKRFKLYWLLLLRASR